MTHKLVQQVRSLDHVAGPGDWRWVRLEDVTNAIGTSAPELLTRFVDAGPSLGLWTDNGAYLVLRPTADGIYIELPSDDVVEISYDETDQFLAIVGPVRVPFGWALEVARLIEQGFSATNTVEFVNYSSVDELPRQDLLWISTVDLGAGHFRAGYALKEV